MLTISRLSHRSIKYYNDTAHQATHAATKHQTPGGGLAEYYSESETRIQLAHRRRQARHRGRHRPQRRSARRRRRRH